MGEPSAQVVDTGHGSDEQRQKKAAGNAAHQQGDECVEGAGFPATPPSSMSLRGREHRLRTAKKRVCSEGVGSKGSSELAPDKNRYALTLALHDALNASCTCFGLPLLDQFDVGPALLK